MIKHLKRLLALVIVLLQAGWLCHAQSDTTLSLHGKAVTLNSKSGYALQSLSHKATDFQSQGFPAFEFMHHKTGKKVKKAAGDSKLDAKLVAQTDSTLSVEYTYSGTRIQLDYMIGKELVTVTTTVLAEGDYKAMTVYATEGVVITRKNSLKDASSAVLTAPARQGMNITLENEGGSFNSKENYANFWYTLDTFAGWTLVARFISMLNDNTYIIVHPTHHSCKYYYGRDKLSGGDTLYINILSYFRPEKTVHTHMMPLLNKSLSMEISFCGDENNDSTVDWVDAGIAYRDRYIERCVNIDPMIKDSFVGKFNIDSWNTYESVLSALKTKLDVAPHVWWAAGAHVKGKKCYDQNWWDFEPVFDSGNFYDARKSAKAHDIRIGVHQNIDDVYKDHGWDEEVVSRSYDGTLLKGGVWGGLQAYTRDLPHQEQSGQLYKVLDKHFSTWAVKPTDTWHYDAYGVIHVHASYRADKPTSAEMSYQTRKRVAQYIAGKGIKLTTEGIVEGLHQYLSFGLTSAPYRSMGPNLYYDGKPIDKVDKATITNPARITEGFVKGHLPIKDHEWKAIEKIPLYPVLFLGRSFAGRLSDFACLETNPILLARKRAKRWQSNGQALLSGLKVTLWIYNASDKYMDELKWDYFTQMVFWSKMCDQSVIDINKKGDFFTMTLSNGDVLKMNPDSQTDDFSYTSNGIKHQGFSPFNCWGYMGIWKKNIDITVKSGVSLETVSGDVELKYRKRRNGMVRITGRNPQEKLIIVKKQNTRPAVEKVLLPSRISAGKSAKLRVKAKDKDRDRLTYTWAKCSGPGSVTFNSNGTGGSRSIQARFSEAGLYTLAVTVSDKHSYTIKQTAVTVSK